MRQPHLPAAELDRIRAQLEARRASLRLEVKAQLRGSGDDRVVIEIGVTRVLGRA